MKSEAVTIMSKRRHPKVAIIDYDMGNIFSVRHVCSHVGLDCIVTSDSHELSIADAAILPGVGAFGEAMENLKRLGLISTIKDFIAAGKPFLGVCLGLQLLFTTSEEFGIHEGLNIIPGTILKFKHEDAEGNKVKIPHMGWNRIFKPAREGPNPWDASPLRGIREGAYMYFVHSYYVVPDSHDVVASITDYAGIRYCSGILYKNVFATQYHPEKSAREGIKIYENWSKMITIT
jgi:imidazole glycerol-phosphate synthase subunit HisH